MPLDRFVISFEQATEFLSPRWLSESNCNVCYKSAGPHIASLYSPKQTYMTKIVTNLPKKQQNYASCYI